MNLEKVGRDNVETAISIQEELFPGESGRENFIDSLDPSNGYEYYLILEDGAPAGIIGLYTYKEDPDSAWLGWFGIREQFRRRHLGSMALKRFEERAAEKQFRFARLYTDAVNNDAAIAFYKANGYTCEPYENADDPACMEYKMLIFSKLLKGDELVPWNSRSIHLTEQIEKQNKYSRQ